MFKIQKQSEAQAGMTQIAGHLGDVSLVECGYDLGVDYDQIINDKVRNQRSDVVFLEVYGKRNSRMGKTTTGQLDFTALNGKKITAVFDEPQVSSDGGVLLLREVDRHTGLIDRLAAVITDQRRSSHVAHQVAELLRQRTYQISCGYEDADDCDYLRADSHHTKPAVMRWMDAHGIDYITGLSPNNKLKELFALAVRETEIRFRRTGRETRGYAAAHYAAGTWERTRRVTGLLPDATVAVQSHYRLKRLELVIRHSCGGPPRPENTGGMAALCQKTVNITIIKPYP